MSNYNFVNGRGRWRGHLFEERFASVAMDQSHLISAVCYVARNPVRARLVYKAEEWRWSSTRAHLEGKDDGLVVVGPVLERVPDFAALLAAQVDDASFAALRAAEHTGRPLGNGAFIEGLERILGRRIARRAPGRKAKRPSAEQLKFL